MNSRIFQLDYINGYFANNEQASIAVFTAVFRFTNVQHHLIKLKVRLSPSQISFFICFNDSPSKMMKNAFHFILKALFVLKIFKFCLGFFDM